MQRSNKHSNSPSTETRLKTRGNASSGSTLTKQSSISKQLIIQSILGFTILILAIVVVALLRSNGIGPTIEQELAQEGYMAELIRTVKESYPSSIPSSLFTIKKFNAQIITVLVTNTKNLKLKVKCSAIDRTSDVKSTDVWSASNSQSVVMEVNKDKSAENESTSSMTLLELYYPLNHSFVYCSAVDPEIPEPLFDSMDTPLYKLNEIPLRLFLPIERSELGAILFSKSLHHVKREPSEETILKEDVKEVEIKENEKEDEGDKEVVVEEDNKVGEDEEEVEKDVVEAKIVEKADEEVQLPEDNNKEFILKLLKRKYVSSSCSLFYAEDYLPTTLIHTSSTPSISSGDKIETEEVEKELTENNAVEEQAQDEVNDVSMDFTAYYLEPMNKHPQLGKRIFNFRTIVDSWKVNIFNATETTTDSSTSLGNTSSFLNELKASFFKQKEFADLLGKLKLHENAIKLHHLYKSTKEIKLSCALYTGAKELKEQNLPPLEPETELFTFSNKEGAVDCSKYNITTDSTSDGKNSNNKVERTMCLYYANSPIFKSWYVPSLFNHTVTIKTTSATSTEEGIEDEKEEEIKMSEDTANDLALFSKYVHFIAMDGSVPEFDEVLNTIKDIEPENSLVAAKNHTRINIVLDITMFIAETVNRMKSPMSNTHSSMKIMKFNKMYTVLNESIKFMKELLKGDGDGEKVKEMKGFIANKKKYIEL